MGQRVVEAKTILRGRSWKDYLSQKSHVHWKKYFQLESNLKITLCVKVLKLPLEEEPRGQRIQSSLMWEGTLKTEKREKRRLLRRREGAVSSAEHVRHRHLGRGTDKRGVKMSP